MNHENRDDRVILPVSLTREQLEALDQFGKPFGQTPATLAAAAIRLFRPNAPKR